MVEAADSAQNGKEVLPKNPLNVLEATALEAVLEARFDLLSQLQPTLKRAGSERFVPLTPEEIAAPFEHIQEQINAFAHCQEGRGPCDFGAEVKAIADRLNSISAKRGLKPGERADMLAIRQEAIAPVVGLTEELATLKDVLSQPSLERNEFLKSLGLYSPGAPEELDQVKARTLELVAAIARGERLDELHQALIAARSIQLPALDPYETITRFINELGRLNPETAVLSVEEVAEALQKNDKAREFVESPEGTERLAEATETLRNLSNASAAEKLGAWAPEFPGYKTEEIAPLLGRKPLTAFKSLPALLDAIDAEKVVTVAPAQPEVAAAAPEAEAEAITSGQSNKEPEPYVQTRSEQEAPEAEDKPGVASGWKEPDAPQPLVGEPREATLTGEREAPEAENGITLLHADPKENPFHANALPEKEAEAAPAFRSTPAQPPSTRPGWTDRASRQQAATGIGRPG